MDTITIRDIFPNGKKDIPSFIAAIKGSPVVRLSAASDELRYMLVQGPLMTFVGEAVVYQQAGQAPNDRQASASLVTQALTTTHNDGWWNPVMKRGMTNAVLGIVRSLAPMEAQGEISLGMLDHRQKDLSALVSIVAEFCLSQIGGMDQTAA